ncbi:GerAB/ArcD/ProY family transporter [Alkalihalobacillus sp. 1P02AB]|uniref:GerAB/ArcD/ProY family transporter n=1 Tax=Alkalihalobacillus sp. 1P02AB TaxID=3132260 RepID=UPI0039A71C44
MDNETKVNYRVSNFFLFFMITTSQVGVGLLSYQSLIVTNARHDGWLSVLITGLSLHLILWMIYKILEGETNDIISFHKAVFGTFITKVSTVLLSIYFLSLSFVVLRSYINIVQVWAFPTISIWELAICILLLIYYIVSGGFRVITGVSFLAFFIPLLLLMFSLYFPLRMSNFNNILPVFNLSFFEFLQSSKDSSLIFIGFESLLVYFPFLKNGDRSKKWANAGLIYTTSLYTIVAIVSLTYFSLEQIIHYRWPTLEMIKIFDLPFIERFEYIFIFCWLIVIIPTICVPLWSICRMNKKAFNIKPRITLMISLVVLLFGSILIDNHIKIEATSELVSNIGFYFIYLYIPFLFFIRVVKN